MIDSNYFEHYSSYLREISLTSEAYQQRCEFPNECSNDEFT